MSIAPHDPDSEVTSENAPQDDDFQWPSPEHVARVLAGVKRVEIEVTKRTKPFQPPVFDFTKAPGYVPPTDEEVEQMLFEGRWEKHMKGPDVE